MARPQRLRRARDHPLAPLVPRRHVRPPEPAGLQSACHCALRPNHHRARRLGARATPRHRLRSRRRRRFSRLALHGYADLRRNGQRPLPRLAPHPCRPPPHPTFLRLPPRPQPCVARDVSLRRHGPRDAKPRLRAARREKILRRGRSAYAGLPRHRRPRATRLSGNPLSERRRHHRSPLARLRPCAHARRAPCAPRPALGRAVPLRRKPRLATLPRHRAPPRPFTRHRPTRLVPDLGLVRSDHRSRVHRRMDQRPAHLAPRRVVEIRNRRPAWRLARHALPRTPRPHYARAPGHRRPVQAAW